MPQPLDVPELPGPVTASPDGAWSRDPATGVVTGEALPHSDLYVNPGGEGAGDAESLLNAATLLATPPAGDFRLVARVAAEHRSLFDAGVLLLWDDETHWAKLCLERSPAGAPMVVSVVTRGTSDDANAFVLDAAQVWLRISRVDGVYAFHAAAIGAESAPDLTWQLVRVFSLGTDLAGHRVGLEVQSPTGDGCTVTFADVVVDEVRLADLRDGS